MAMASDVSVAEAKRLRDKMERDIASLLREYHTKTGMVIESLTVFHLESNETVVDHVVEAKTIL